MHLLLHVNVLLSTWMVSTISFSFYLSFCVKHSKEKCVHVYFWHFDLFFAIIQCLSLVQSDCIFLIIGWFLINYFIFSARTGMIPGYLGLFLFFQSFVSFCIEFLLTIQDLWSLVGLEFWTTAELAWLLMEVLLCFRPFVEFVEWHWSIILLLSVADVNFCTDISRCIGNAHSVSIISWLLHWILWLTISL